MRLIIKCNECREKVAWSLTCRQIVCPLPIIPTNSVFWKGHRLPLGQSPPSLLCPYFLHSATFPATNGSKRRGGISPLCPMSSVSHSHTRSHSHHCSLTYTVFSLCKNPSLANRSLFSSLYHFLLLAAPTNIMSFSSLVQDIAFRDPSQQNPRASGSTINSNTDAQSTISRRSQARSYTSTAATSVSIAGDISSQLHAGYSHPLSRAWQAERQLTKVCSS